MLLVLVLTTDDNPSKLLVRTPTAPLKVNNEVEIPGMLPVVVKR